MQAQAVHRRSRGAAGSRTIAKMLGISRWRARKLMQACRLVSTQPSKPKFRLAQAEAEAVPNLLKRAFQPTAPNRVWCGDLTSVRVAGQWAYVAVVLDVYARRVGGVAGVGDAGYGLGPAGAWPGSGNPPTGEGLTLSFGPRGAISQSQVPTISQETSDQPKYESQRELLGQCADGTLVP